MLHRTWHLNYSCRGQQWWVYPTTTVFYLAEKRVSFGNFVVNKNIKKTFSVTDHVGAACAGMIADMQVPCETSGGACQDPQVGDTA